MEETILETIKTCQQRQEAPLLWAMEVGKCLVSLGMRLPSPELGHVLVPYLCFDNNHPSLWKFLQQALSSRLLYPIHILSLLSARVIPNRRSQPEAYRLYLELSADMHFHLIQLAKKLANRTFPYFRVQVQELGHVLVLFFFSIVVGLIDSTFNDWGLRMKSSDIPSGPFGNADNKDMDVDAWGNYNIGRYEHRELLRKTNSLFAIERLLFYKANKLVSSNMESANQLLERLSANIQRVYDFEYQLNRHQIIQMLVDIKPSKPISYCNSESGQSSCWVPFDIYMENAMDGKQLHIRPSVAILTGSWKSGCMDRLERQVEGNGQTSRKHELILSLQVLGDFSGLLCPPSSVMGAANNAALMAASFISNSKNTKSGSGDANRTDPSVNAGGNMWHLIVEACIARNLIDVSAYYWPGYVSASVISLVSDLPPVQKSPWLTFMEGAPLNNSLVNSLLTTPAPCLAEIEKLYHIALNGSAEEKSAAAKVLCGASLTRGWNIQMSKVTLVSLIPSM
ncbi:hypothetical protein GH714_019550 [Hevea brasiliensis]|uniref:Mediator of RNA polymerase II transcription subunit 33A n=1 Tax=Hevea brasiliensis TaxID=3981 RepID=A0A6A6M1A2_HEVBR|nr:hypothetical protein GH714_019550 [Hevea brasiliensis]